MAPKDIKLFLASRVIRDMQIKATTKGYLATASDWQKSKKSSITEIWQR